MVLLSLHLVGSSLCKIILPLQPRQIFFILIFVKQVIIKQDRVHAFLPLKDFTYPFILVNDKYSYITHKNKHMMTIHFTRDVFVIEFTYHDQ